MSKNDDDATLKLYNVTMTNNYTNSKGGGAICNHGELRIEGFEFKNNTSGGNGGAIWTNTSLYLENGTMDGNESKETGDDNGGGAIMCDSGSATIKVYNTEFTNNTAASDGGAVKTKGTNEFRNCTFTGNSANDKGGALDLAHYSVTNFYACTIKNNTCPKGSALRYDNHAKYYFNDGTSVTGSIY